MIEQSFDTLFYHKQRNELFGYIDYIKLWYISKSIIYMFTCVK